MCGEGEKYGITTQPKRKIQLLRWTDCKQHFSTYNWTRTVALIALWFAMGMSHRITPATLPDTRARVGITVEEFGRSSIFTGVGGIVGALLGGVSDRYIDKSDLILSVMTAISATALALRPFCRNWWTFAIGCLFEGLGWACVNSVGNPMIVAMWGEHSGGPMQALHFGYPLGAMVGPLIAYPFVSRQTAGNASQWINTTENTQPLYSLTNNTSMVTSTNSRIEIPYIIIACFDIFMAALFMVFQCVCNPVKREDKTKNRLTSSNWREVMSPTRWGGGSFRFGLTMVSLLMLFYFLQVATVRGFVAYYTSYAVESDLAFTNQQGTLYSSATQLAGALGRAVGSISAIFIPMSILFPVIVGGQAIAAVCTVIWGLQSTTGYIVTCCMFSFTSYQVWPGGYSWANTYIYLFAIIVGMAQMCSKLGDITFGYLLGYLYDYTDKKSIFYNAAVAGIVLFILSLIMNVIGFKHGSKFTKKKLSDEDILKSDGKDVIKANEITEI